MLREALWATFLTTLALAIAGHRLSENPNDLIGAWDGAMGGLGLYVSLCCWRAVFDGWMYDAKRAWRRWRGIPEPPSLMESYWNRALLEALRERA